MSSLGGPAEPESTEPLLGRGGQGEVRIVHDQRLPRRLARKRLSPELRSQPAARERFEREAALLAQLNHPGIPTIYETGRDEQGPYYTMSLIEGLTLAQAREGGTSAQELLAAFRQVCQVLAYAHGAGVLHRDLKPSNIMLGAHGRVYVVDWGISRVEQQSELALTERDWPTLTRAALGTPGYLAPEQARGEPEQGRAVDIWGLGGLLTFILCGRPPISGGDEEQRLDRARRGELDAWPAEVSGPLRSLLQRALHRDPAQRYPEAESLLRDFDAWRAEERVLAHRYSAAERLRRLARRHGGRLALLGLLGLGLAAMVWRSRALTELSRSEARVAEAARLSSLAWERAQQRDLGGIRLAASSLRLGESPRARGALIALRPDRLPQDLWQVNNLALMRSPQRLPGGRGWRGLGEYQGILSGDFSRGSRIQRSDLGKVNVRDWAPSPDGRRMAIAVVGPDPARIYSADAVLLHRLPGHASSVLDIAWGGDGQVYTIDSAAQVRAFDEAGELRWSAAAAPGSEGLAWAPGLLYTASPAQGIHALDPATGRPLPPPAPLAHGHGRMAASPDGRRVAAGVIMGGISQVTVMEEGRLRARFPTLSPPAELAWSPDGRWLAVGEELGKVLLWEADSGQILLRWSTWGQAVRGMVWSEDGTELLAGNYGCGAVLIDLSALQLERPSRAHAGRVVGQTRWGDLLLSLGAEGGLRAWQLPGMELRWERQLGESGVALGQAAGGMVDVLDGPGTLTRLRAADGEVLSRWTGPPDRFHHVAPAPDGCRAALSRFNGPPLMVDLCRSTAIELSALDACAGRGQFLLWSADPQALIYPGDQAICRWREGAEPEALQLQGLALVSRAAASPGGGAVALMDFENRLVLIDGQGELVQSARWPVRPSALALDEREGLIAVATIDSRLLLGRLSDLQLLAEWPLPSMATSLLFTEGRLWVGTVEGQLVDYPLAPLQADPWELEEQVERRLHLGPEGESARDQHWGAGTVMVRFGASSSQWEPK